MTVPRERTSEWTLWVVAVSCALHVAEEYFTGWQDWARDALGNRDADREVSVHERRARSGRAAARPGGMAAPGAQLGHPVGHYVPFSSMALVGAAHDGVPRTAIAAGVVAGTVMMLSVVVAARWLSAA